MEVQFYSCWRCGTRLFGADEVRHSAAVVAAAATPPPSKTKRFRHGGVSGTASLAGGPRRRAYSSASQRQACTSLFTTEPPGWAAATVAGERPSRGGNNGDDGDGGDDGGDDEDDDVGAGRDGGSTAHAGPLDCPHCAARVGAYCWSGRQCSCGVWVTPAFQFGGSKVDPKWGDRISRVQGEGGGVPAGAGASTVAVGAARVAPAGEVVEAVELLDREGGLLAGVTAAASGRGDAILGGNGGEGHEAAVAGP